MRDRELFESLFREGNGVNISSCAATVKAGTPESFKNTSMQGIYFYEYVRCI